MIASPPPPLSTTTLHNIDSKIEQYGLTAVLTNSNISLSMMWEVQWRVHAHITTLTIFLVSRGSHWCCIQIRVQFPTTKEECPLPALSLDIDAPVLTTTDTSSNPTSNSCEQKISLVFSSLMVNTLDHAR